MKTALIAVLFAVAATAAIAQLAAPAATTAPDPAPAVRAEPAGDPSGHARLKTDRARVKADKERLKAARAARDDDAIRTAQVVLQTDMAAWHADREGLQR